MTHPAHIPDKVKEPVPARVLRDLLEYALPILEQAAQDTLTLMPGSTGHKLFDQQQVKIRQIKEAIGKP